MMRRRSMVALTALLFAGTGMSAYAACPPVFPPYGYNVTPDNDVQAFLMYSEADRMETLVVQPAFSGTATEFGMVMPLPARPEINEAPEDIFDILTEYTFEVVWSAQKRMDVREGASSVVIVEEKDVGDFTAIVLTAESADDLVEWLNSNGFEFVDEDRENFSYYVEKGGYYFVAMKINMDEADVSDDGKINGKLRPVEFVFESEYPMLPLRIMAHDMDPMRFTLYTLGIFPYYIPGVDVLFLDVIDKPEISEEKISQTGTTQEHQEAASQDSITNVPHMQQNDLSSPESDEMRLGAKFWERYRPLDKWLVRMNVGFDPREIEQNLILERIGKIDETNMDPRSPIKISGADVTLIIPLIINQKLLPPDSGVFAEYSLVWHDFPDIREVMSPRLQAEYGIPPQSIDCKSGLQLMLRPDGYNTACIAESNVPILAERGWQESTLRVDELSRLR